MDLDFAIRHSYGVIRTDLLLRCGLTKTDIRKRVAVGTLSRLRHGWYSAPGANRDAGSAVRAGGVLTCVSALRLREVWTPIDSRVHMRQSNHGKYRSRRPSGQGIVCCGGKIGNYRPATGVDPVLVALTAAAGCVSDEELVAIIDSLLHSGRAELGDVREALRDHPARIRRLLDFVDPKAESGTESIVRFRLAQRRIKCLTQVKIAGVGRVDLLVGRRFVIEVDSRAHHTDKDAYESDRRRDRRLVLRRYLVVRLTYDAVMYEWAEVEADLLTLIRRREHLRSPEGLGPTVD